MKIGLRGGDLQSPPDEYVEAQFWVNDRHHNGQTETFGENREEDARKYVRTMLRLLRERNIAWQSFLDVGCRVGYVCDEVATHYPSADVMGVDLIPQFVEEASRYGIDTQVADAHSLPFDDASYDIVFCSQTLEHCWNVRKALSELLRVARTAVFLSLPLENRVNFDGNKCHYAQATNPLDWLLLLVDHPEWTLDFLYTFERRSDEGACINLLLIHPRGVSYENVCCGL